MPSTDNGTKRRARTLRLHLIAYCCASIVFFAVDFFMVGVLWFHWPVMAWGAVAGVHVLYCKSVDVDSDWAERRAIDVRLKSYDLGHIIAIDERHKETLPRDSIDRGAGPER